MPFKYVSIADAVFTNDFDEMKKMHEAGASIHPENDILWAFTTAAATFGNLEMLRYLFVHGSYYMNIRVPRMAATYGKLDCLQFIFENWFVLRSHHEVNGLLTSAAYHGQIQCLKYLHEQGCQISTEAVLWSIKNQNLECLQYLVEVGQHQLNQNDLNVSVSGQGSLECFLYILKQGVQPTAITRANCFKCYNVQLFQYGFVHLCHSPAEKQEYWNLRHELCDDIVDSIDVEKKEWTDLISLDLTLHPRIQAKVQARREQLKEKCQKHLSGHVLPDILKFCLYPFL